MHIKESILSSCLIVLVCTNAYGSAITYGFSGGRFGDKLASFSHALWLSYKRDIPLIYRPFRQGNKLQLSRLHKSFESVKNVDYSKVVSLKAVRKKGVKKFNIYKLDTSKDYLYVTPYIPISHKEKKNGRFQFDVDWEDEGFINLLRKEIASIEPVKKIELPEGRFPVAVHIRTGYGNDRIKFRRRKTFQDIKLPLKFPPDSFYIEYIEKMSELLDDQPMYVHIFTDHPYSEGFAKLFEKEVNKPNISYGYRKNPTIFEDFFGMAQFEYFIRPDSNFSFFPEKLSNWKISIVPSKSSIKGRVLAITKATISVR